MQGNKTIHTGAAGCGMGLYAIALIGVCIIGIAGIVGATIGLLNSEPEEARGLVHGSEVAVWRLQAMRKAGLLSLTEIPAAWHDESPRFDGTTACVLTTKHLSRLEDGLTTTIPWALVRATEVARTKEDTMTITVIGENHSLACNFGPNEGAERFLRMVEAEIQRGIDAAN
jgi:hypothetical protein